MKKRKCLCGCGKYPPAGKKYLNGHNRRGKKHSRQTKEVLRKKRISKLRIDRESLSPHRLKFPSKRKKGEALGAYKVRKFLFFCSNYLVHVHGKFAGRPVILMKWQQKIIEKVLGTLNEDGTRQYRRVILHVARKNGKSFLASLLLLYFLCEESFEDRGMEIVSVALSKIQSQGTVFKTCRMLVEHSKELTQLIRIRRVPASLTNVLTDGVYEPLSSDGKLQLGRNISLAVVDETHGLPSDELWQSIETSMGLRRQPLLISVSTAGDSRGSFYFNEIYSPAKEILRDPSIDPTTAPFIFEVDEALDWRDPRNFPLANPALDEQPDGEKGFRPAGELLSALQRALKTESAGAFQQYYLNRFAAHGSRTFVPLDHWDRCAREIDLEGMGEQRVVAGLDFSSTTDLTALAIIVEPPEGSKVWTTFVFHWLAGLSLPECEKRDRLHYQKFIAHGSLFFDGKEVIDVLSVLDVLGSLKKHFPKLKIIGYDPYLKSEITKLDEFFTLTVIPQQFGFMSPALKLLKAKIFNQELQHDGDLLLRAMIENTRIVEDHAGNIRTDKAKSRSRIDGLVALTIATAIAIQENFRR